MPKTVEKGRFIADEELVYLIVHINDGPEADIFYDILENGYAELSKHKHFHQHMMDKINQSWQYAGLASRLISYPENRKWSERCVSRMTVS